MMVPRFPHKKFITNWLKALMLSPGMLFPAGYLLIYLSVNIYLNSDFKKNVVQSINQTTGNTWQISIASLKPGLVLDSVTIDHIELTPVTEPGSKKQKSNRTITIKTLQIPFPGLQKLLFSSKERLSSAKTVCEKILADEHFIQ